MRRTLVIDIWKLSLNLHRFDRELPNIDDECPPHPLSPGTMLLLGSGVGGRVDCVAQRVLKCHARGVVAFLIHSQQWQVATAALHAGADELIE